MSSEKNKVLLKKIKDSPYILLKDYNLVIKSSKDKTVIGRYVDEKILHLNKESKEISEKIGFNYDDTFIKDEDDEQGDEEEVGDDDEEEGDEEGGDDEGGDEEGEAKGEDSDEAKGGEDSDEAEGGEDKREDVVKITEPIVELVKKEVHQVIKSEIHEFKNPLLLDSFLIEFQTLRHKLVSVETDYLFTIDGLTNKLVNKTEDYISLQEKYDKLIEDNNKLIEDNNKLNEDYKVLKGKFEGIRSLFSA